jgi:hypothetical protein
MVIHGNTPDDDDPLTASGRRHASLCPNGCSSAGRRTSAVLLRRHSGNSARSAHPGWSMGDHGKQVSWLAVLSPCITFPDLVNPVAFDAGHTAYSCGGSPGFNPSSLSIPVRGTCRVSNVAAKRSPGQLTLPSSTRPPSDQESVCTSGRALTVTLIAGRLSARSGVRRLCGRWVKREAGEDFELIRRCPRNGK